MKKFTLLFSINFFSIISIAQWQATNLTSVNYLALTSTASFKGELYSIVNNGFTADVYQLDAGSTSWTKKTISGISGSPNYILAAGSNIYLTSNNSGSSYLYKASDIGSTFSLDTVGLPKFLNGIMPFYGVKFFNGKVLVNLGSAGYWLKDTSAASWNHIDVSTKLNGGGDPLCYSKDTLFAKDNSGAYDFYVSGDYGQTWVQRNTDLPTNFSGKVLESNSVSGRLYMAGGKSDGTVYGIYYSDDNGFKWKKANLSAFIDKDVNGGQQEVKAIYAEGNTVYVSLENSIKNTTPDILKSSNEIENMAYDTLGLMVDASGTVYGLHFTRHKGDMALTLTTRDVYLNSFNSGIFNEDKNKMFSVYPNPANNNFTIQLENIDAVSTIDVLDVYGKQIKSIQITNSPSEINCSTLSNGIYFVRIIGEDGRVGVKKIIKQ